jgi:menaquinol-cytochrome c reductase iron-sulfur subunit
MADGDIGPRRGFLAAITAALGGLVSAMAAMPAFTFLAYPLRVKTVSGNDEPIRVAMPDEVRSGKPLRVTVFGPRRDGWTRIDRMKLGSAWLVRTPQGRVRAFSTVCPHLGCKVDWNEKAEKFDCPCHNSSFGVDGRCLAGPAPRPLDELEVVASEREIRIRYQRFRVAIPEKEPIG